MVHSPRSSCIRRLHLRTVATAINEPEARQVREIFDLYLGREGPPKGLKAIVSHLNERGITRRGRRFGTGSLHDLLVNPAYVGRHQFNHNDSRARQARQRRRWTTVAVTGRDDDLGRVASTIATLLSRSRRADLCKGAGSKTSLTTPSTMAKACPAGRPCNVLPARSARLSHAQATRRPTMRALRFEAVA